MLVEIGSISEEEEIVSKSIRLIDYLPIERKVKKK